MDLTVGANRAAFFPRLGRAGCADGSENRGDSFDGAR